MWSLLKTAQMVKNRGVVEGFFRQISSKYIEINEEVRYGLENNRAIVALESTIITHGMPYPNNQQCALEAEAIIRTRGAIPATIAILGGKIKVGLTTLELEQLISQLKKVETVKTSRRDFSYVIANKLNGGTTVAGTLIVANRVGIPVFATGGIGGVHRKGEETFDISADLTELGKSSVAVISSGVKSILDIPKTLEYLETQGVFVAAFGGDKVFPAFYCRNSGSVVPYNVSEAKEAANIINCHLELGLGSGLLFAVPVPKKFAMDEKEMNSVIEQAMISAEERRIYGKQITPYLLAHITQLTKGSSLETNLALIKNNAGVAADIAVELAQLREKSSSGGGFRGNTRVENNEKIDNKQPVIIGGSVLDCCVTLKEDEIRLDGRIHDATFKYHAGGVARNITEALSKLGCQPTFISVIGDDVNGQYLHSLLPTTCTKRLKRTSKFNTAQCIVLFDSKGDCKLLIGDMGIHELITPEMIIEHEEVIKGAPMLVLDANLTKASLSAALKLAGENNVPVFFEPTDVPVAGKPFNTAHWKAIKYITPNLLELTEIAKALDISYLQEFSWKSKIDEAAFLGKLVANYVPNVIVTLGEDGLIIARRGRASDRLLCDGFVDKNLAIEARHYPVINEVKNGLINVSGAGDCLAGGLIAAMLKGLREEKCVEVGFAAALKSLYSTSPVPSVLFDEKHQSWLSLSQAKHQVLN